jgi:acyl-CoA thioesterase-1
VTRLAIFGDSIAWGSWDPEAGGWAARLKCEYMQRLPPENEPDAYVGVYVSATPGHRVADVAARLDNDLAAIKADWVAVAIGTNDAAHKDHPSTPADDFRRSYKEVIDRCNASAERVVALTTPNVIGEACGYTNIELQAINEIIGSVCAETSVDVIDLHGLLGDSDVVADGVHPNSRGHELLFRHVLAALTERGL